MSDLYGFLAGPGMFLGAVCLVAGTAVLWAAERGRRGRVEPATRAHVTDRGAACWCRPEVLRPRPGGPAVVVHRGPEEAEDAKEYQDF